MKSIKKHELTRLFKAFSAAYNKKEEFEHDSMWQVRLMGHIRSMEPVYLKESYLDLLQRYVWRLAPVSCALALVLGMAITQIDFISEYELAKMFIEDPVDYSLFSLYER